MKIGELSQIRASATIKTWASDLAGLELNALLSALENFVGWDQPRLDDLSGVAWLLDRFDEILESGIQAGFDPALISIVLEKTALILKNSTNHSLYNSVDQILVILDCDDWNLIHKALDVLYLLVNRVTPSIKSTKAHRNTELSSKLYALAIGDLLNNPTPVNLYNLCIGGTLPIDTVFQYTKGDSMVQVTSDFEALEAELPDNLKYILKNRLRIAKHLGDNDTMELMAICQLTAIAILLQCNSGLDSNFSQTLPELWLLGNIPDIMRAPKSPILHTACLKVLAAILVILEGHHHPRYQQDEQLINQTLDLLASWQQHGFLQSLLRDIGSPEVFYVQEETARYPDFVVSLLHLTSLLVDYKYRVDSAHVSGMTMSILQLVRVPENHTYNISLQSIAQALQILSVLISQSIEMFKEINGLDTIIALTSHELQLLAQISDTQYAPHIQGKPTESGRVQLIRLLMKILRTSMQKWEHQPMPGMTNQAIMRILESDVIDCMRGVFERRCFDVYEYCVSLITYIVSEQVQFMSDLITRGILHALLQSLETELPPLPKLFSSIVKLLCACAQHSEAARLIESFNTISRLIQVLGSTEGVSLTNELSNDTGESLIELLNRVSSLKEKAIEGSIELISSLLDHGRTAENLNKELFFSQLTNIGRLFATLFSFSNDLVKTFMDKGGLDLFLSIFKLPILPLNYSNDYNTILNCLKQIPQNHGQIFLVKVLTCLSKQIAELEELIGPLEQAMDFNGLEHDPLYILIYGLDSYVEMTRIIMLNQASVGKDSITMYTKIVTQLGHLLRILIREQARLSPFSKMSEKTTSTFNMPIDVKDIENVELKSFDENSLFSCQLSLRKFFKITSRFGINRSRNMSEDNITIIYKTLGQTLARLAQQLNIESEDQYQAYYLSLLLSDIVKILLQDQTSCITIVCFNKEGGVNSIFNFLAQLVTISQALSSREENSYDYVNSIQLLWTLCGKFIDSLAQARFASSSMISSILKVMGFDDAKEVARDIHKVILENLQNIDIVHCSCLSNTFVKSIVEVYNIMLMSLRETNQVDENSVVQLVEMGFSPQQAQTALLHVGASSVEMAMEWLLSNPESGEAKLTDQEWNRYLVDVLSQLPFHLINILKVSNALSQQVSELLLKSTMRLEVAHINIAEKLIENIESLQAQFMAGEPVLEMLSGLLSSLSLLAQKSAEILTALKTLAFSDKAFEVIQHFTREPEKFGEVDWLGPILQIADALIKYEGENSDRWSEILAELVKTDRIFSESNHSAILQLLGSTTTTMKGASLFLPGLPNLLSIGLDKPEVRFRNMISAYSQVIRQLAEDPYLTQVNFEIAIRSCLATPQTLESFMGSFGPQLKRAREEFKKACENATVILKKENSCVVEERHDSEPVTGERWDVLGMLVQALLATYESEQKHENEKILQSEHLVSLISDVIQAYPLLIPSLLTRKFIKQLVQSIIPLRYSLQLTDNKLLFVHPGTDVAVTPQNYQNWIKSAIKLLKAMCFKQVSKSASKTAADMHNTIMLQNNTGVMKARKKIFREIRDMLAMQVKKEWFGDERAMNIVRTAAIMTMQLLREQANAPYTTNNPAELAKMLVSEQFNLIKLLCDAARGVKLGYKKAPSILAVIIAPIELLSRFNISFVLKASKNTGEKEASIEEAPLDPNIEKFEVYSESEGSHEEGYYSHSRSYSQDEHASWEQDEDEIEPFVHEDDEVEEDEESQSFEEEEEPMLEEIVIARRDEQFWADVDEEIEEDERGDPFGIRMQMHRQPPMHHHLDERQLFNAEHAFIPAANEFDDPMLGYGGYRRHLFDFDESNAANVMSLMREMRETDHEEFLQMIMQRRMPPPMRAQAVENLPRANTEMTDAMIQDFTIEMAQSAQDPPPVVAPPIEVEEPPEPSSIAIDEPSSIAIDEPMMDDPSSIAIEEPPMMIPQIPEMQLPPGGLMSNISFPNPAALAEMQVPMDIEMPEGLSPEEEMIRKIAADLGSINPYQAPPEVAPPQFDIPPDIDPTFLEALPEELRAEVLAQHTQAQRPPAPATEDFLDALPPDIRQEVIEQQREPAAPTQEIDNATFVASLTPELRRDVLLTANEEFLATLPPELVAEARQLQERAVHHRPIIGEARGHQPVRREEETKEISEIVSDPKLSSQLTPVEDNFLELLMRALYLSAPVNPEIYKSLILNLSANTRNRSMLVDGLTTLLQVIEPSGVFPPQQLWGSEGGIVNYRYVYEVVSQRILEMLRYLSRLNPKISQYYLKPDKYRLPCIAQISKERQSLKTLIYLLNMELFRTSGKHLESLVALIGEITGKIQTPTLEIECIGQLCQTLTYNSANETTVSTVIDLVKKLAEIEANRDITRKVLIDEITIVGQELTANLQALKTSPEGVREVQLLRMCKVLSSISDENPEVFQHLTPLWEPFTSALIAITGNVSELASTTNPILSKLLPVIETFFIANSADSSSALFQNFCESNRKVLNLLVKQDPALLDETFNSLVSKHSFLLDFDNKKNYFRMRLKKVRPERNMESIRLRIKRDDVFMESYHQLRGRSTAEMYGRLRVQFTNEEGVDAGGLTREWYQILSREMFNPGYALFVTSANNVTFQPSPFSHINQEHLTFFKFIGRIMGKAICDGYHLDAFFTRAFYKHVLGQEVTYTDMEDLDPEYYKNLKWLLEENIDETDLFENYFVYEAEELGRMVFKELIPGGKDIRVTEANKMEYVQGICDMKLTNNIREQTASFLEGFYELIPKDLISIFNAKELELMVSGLPEVDLEDLQNNTDYVNYTKTSPVIVWLWEILEEMNNDKRAEFIQFVTGTSKVPLDGFKALQGMNGIQKLQIHKSFVGPDKLPTSHTCMNQLDLPEYPSKEVLRNRLMISISEGKEGFGFM